MKRNDEGDPEELDFEPQEVTSRFEETHIRLDKLILAAQALALYKYRALQTKDEKIRNTLWARYYAAEKLLAKRRDQLLEVLDV